MSNYELVELDAAWRGSMYSGKLRYFPEIESTNTLAMQAAGSGAEEGTVFLANQQTAGRGRNGHEWHSEPGTAILVSVILRPRIAPSQALWLSLMAGVAVHEAIARTSGISCDLRWPNDLLIGQKKVCGILTEISADSEQLRFAVVGIGINVNQQSFPPEIAHLATSLQIETGKIWPRTALLIALLQSLEVAYRHALGSGGTEALLHQVESISSYARGKRVHVDEAGGYEGTTDGLDRRGFLRVRTPTGIKTVFSGGVREAYWNR
ncbi:MAG TPA: biotin--[acetyl-CoA-carboxylase] ligase [Terriglobales bacterium]|nr:biotin--[acetyl-CoA-carboxylase] ligase [Terriglobales bacterium]